MFNLSGRTFCRMFWLIFKRLNGVRGSSSAMRLGKTQDARVMARWGNRYGVRWSILRCFGRRHLSVSGSRWWRCDGSFGEKLVWGKGGEGGGWIGWSVLRCDMLHPGLVSGNSLTSLVKKRNDNDLGRLAGQRLSIPSDSLTKIILYWEYKRRELGEANCKRGRKERNNDVKMTSKCWQKQWSTSNIIQ